MTRILLILALVGTGLAPGAVCLQTVGAASPFAAANFGGSGGEDCGMTCCGTACCCVAHPEPVGHMPDLPATPPRAGDVLTLPVLLASPSYELDDAAYPGRETPGAFYNSLLRGREAVEAQPRLCRWLT